jgi:hypothetical protein
MFHGQGTGQAPSGSGGISGGSEGCVYIELTTSGKAWGRGPLQSDIHGSNKRAVDSPAWRHIKMLSSLISDDGNTPLIKGFLDGAQPLNPEETALLQRAASRMDLTVAASNIGIARYIADDPFTVQKMSRYGTSFNLDGIWAGNMYAGGAGAILPNKVTSKHNMRYVPKMHGTENTAAAFIASWTSPSLVAPSPKYAATTSGTAPVPPAARADNVMPSARPTACRPFVPTGMDGGR